MDRPTLEQQLDTLKKRYRDTAPGTQKAKKIRQEIETLRDQLNALKVEAGRGKTSISPAEAKPSIAASSKSLQVFICYAKEDEAFARQLYKDLKQTGMSPWIACEDILPGQNWEDEIQKALRRSTYVLVLLSSHSISKRGYVRKEIKQALDMLEEFPPSQIYLIPVRLDDSKPLDERLHKIHWVDLWPASAYKSGLQLILKVFAQHNHSKDIEAEVSRPSDLSSQVAGKQPISEKSSLKHKISKTPIIILPSLPLRSEPLAVSEDECREEFKLDTRWQPRQYIKNNFEFHTELVVDYNTGLTWQRLGSDDTLYYEEAQDYMNTLNQKRFAGYTNWRLPTIPELMSLLEPKKHPDGLYLDPIFNTHQRACWSIDLVKNLSKVAWNVDFDVGILFWHGLVAYARGVRSEEP